MSSLIPTFLLSPLRETTRDRRDRAEADLKDGSLSIVITRQTEHELRATVQHGGAAYAVVLSTHQVLCTCPDNAFRGLVCKHAVAVCLQCLHYDTTDSRIHLMWEDTETILCGHALTPATRFWKRWTYNALNWSDIVCQPCVNAWRYPALAKAA